MRISDLNLKKKSLLFATLAADAYAEEPVVRTLGQELGFPNIEFYNLKGAQAYRFENDTDIVIACRGTQPNQFNDLSADLKAFPVKAETCSRVHRGFKAEVDELWPEVSKDIEHRLDKDLWFCGHSLGAAMATIMASRCYLDWDFPDPQELYTYGSPRVGWPGYVDGLKVKHIRWQNNNDIVTHVPPGILNYKHHGDLHYITSKGEVSVSKMAFWPRCKDRVGGVWKGITHGQLDSFSDHAMSGYIEHITKWNKK
jgi:triacylglycerol lipase